MLKNKKFYLEVKLFVFILENLNKYFLFSTFD